MKNLIGMAVIFVFIAACNKHKEAGQAGLRINLTDAPGAYDSVVVYIDSVMVNNDSAGGWQTLITNAGYYDLLQLNGKDTTLVNNSNLPEGKLQQMRLILADGKNYVVDTNGLKSMLELSSQDKTGLKLNINSDLLAGKDYELLIDFDASKSIIDTGSKLRLKPVIKMVYLKAL